MDLIGLHIASGLISAAVEMVATVIVVYCIFSFFSFKPGGSVRFFFISLAYFFSLGFVLVVGSTFLMQLTGPIYLSPWTAVLLMSALIHFAYGILIIFIYARTVVLQ